MKLVLPKISVTRKWKYFYATFFHTSNVVDYTSEIKINSKTINLILTMYDMRKGYASQLFILIHNKFYFY